MVVLESSQENFIDEIVPFYLDHAHIKGRLVRLGKQTESLLANHSYPALVNQYIAEVISLAAVLSVDVKYEGVFTLQISSQPDQASLIRLITVDINTQGHIRAYAQWDQKILHHEQDFILNPPCLQEVFGRGFMVFTADLAHQIERYQAIVELQGKSLTDSMHHFFRQSDQIPTALVLHSRSGSKEREFVAGAVILQRLPFSGDPTPEQQDQDSDDWFTNLSLLGTLTRKELLNPDLSSFDLLYRLFHERNIHILKAKPLKSQCSCSLNRIQKMLENFSDDDRVGMAVDGQIEIICEFCNKKYTLKA